MVTITATTGASSLVAASTRIRQKGFVRVAPSSLPVLKGMGKRGGIRCTIENRTASSENKTSSRTGMTAALIAVSSLTTTMTSHPAMGLVDERMSTEGTGLPFGLSNNILGWILLGIFGLIWTLYFVYTSSLDEDEDSGLSL